MIPNIDSFQEVEVETTDGKRNFSNPVWFVVEDDKLMLLPMYGKETKWFKRLLSNPRIKIKVGSIKYSATGFPLTQEEKVSRVVKAFEQKYGSTEIAKYYVKLDVAVEVKLD